MLAPVPTEEMTGSRGGQAHKVKEPASFLPFFGLRKETGEEEGGVCVGKRPECSTSIIQWYGRIVLFNITPIMINSICIILLLK